MNRDAITVLVDGIFSKALQVRRMLQRGETEMTRLPLAEITSLAHRLEPNLSPDDIEQATASFSKQRWHLPSVELSVQDGYAKWAEVYDDGGNPLIAVEEPAMLGLLGDVAGKDVLDAACGTGRYAVRLAQAGARVCGVDASEEMLAAAKRKQSEAGVNVDFRLGDLTRLPCADASFDLAVCALALCHVADLSSVFAELARVLRPGGRLIVSDFHPFCLQVGWRTVFTTPEASYFIENQYHLTQDYLDALLANGFVLRGLREEVIDDRLLSVWSQEEVERFRGLPAALLISAQRKEQ